MLGSHIRLTTLALFCRTLGTMLQSGIMIQKAFEVAGRKLGDRYCRQVIAEVARSLRRGDDITDALERHGGYFPPLFIDMMSVAESTGTLPEVLRSMADHYENLVRLRRNFLGAITLPLLQLSAAILIIAFVIYILGVIGESRGGAPIDVLGWGLTGASGAMTFLGYTFGSVAAATLTYLFVSRGLGQQRSFHRLFLAIPVVGSCLRAFALARFSWAFYLTQQAGMEITKSLDASLRATSNGAFIAASPQICQRVESGSELATALESSRLFPEDFIEIVHVGETSGTVPEMLERISPHLEDQARRSLSALAAAVGWLVWMLVAGFIIFVIFSIFSWYMGLLNDAMRGL